MKLACPNQNSEEWKKLVKGLDPDYPANGAKAAMATFHRNNDVIPTIEQARKLLDFPEMREVLEANKGATDAETRVNLDEAGKRKGITPKGTNKQKGADVAQADAKFKETPLIKTVPTDGHNELISEVSRRETGDPRVKAITEGWGKDGKPLPDGDPAKKIVGEFNKAEKLQAEKDALTWKKVKAWFVKNLLYAEGRFAYLDSEYLNGALQGSYRKMKMVFDAARGAGAKTMHVFEQLQSDVYAQVPRKWKPVLDRLIEAKRSILIAEKIADGKIRESAYYKDEGFKLAGNATVDDYRAMLAHIKETAGPEMFKKLDDASNIVSNTLRGYITKLKDAGVIQEGLADYLLRVHEFYSPREIIRLIDAETPMTDMKGNRVDVGESGVEALAGGIDQLLNNDWEVLAAQYIGRAEARIAKNAANLALVEHIGDIKKMGGADNPAKLDIETPLMDEKGNWTSPELKGKYGALEGTRQKYQPLYTPEPPPNMARIPYFEAGVRKNILMPSDVAADWVLFDPAMQHSMARILGMLSGSNFVKAMATGANPEFGIFNVFRDMQLYTFTTDVYSKFIPVAYGQMAADMAALRPGSKAYKKMLSDFIQEGGSLELQADMGRESAILKWVKKYEPLEKLANMIVEFNRVSETWTRLALMKRGIDSGMTTQEAAHMARKVCDFATGGKLSKTIDKVIPYFNPGMVVTRNVGEYFAKNPAMALFKSAQYVAMGMGLAYWNRMLHKDAWESVSDRDKESMWIITTPIKYKDATGIERHVYIRFPKDQALRMFSTIGEQMSEKSLTGKADMDSIKTSIDDAFPINVEKLIPPTVKAFAAYAYNQDFWNKVPLWNGRKVSPENEWTAQTPSLAVLWGKTSGMSPERTAGALANIFPINPYTYIIGAIGDAVLPDDNQVHKDFSEYMLNLPGARKLIRLSSPLELSEQNIDRAKTLGVPIVNEDGTPRPPRVVRDEIKEADIHAATCGRILITNSTSSQ
jgi:hypothetical protein